MQKIKYSAIEKMKYKHTKTNLIYFLFALATFFVCNLHILKNKDQILDSTLMLYSSLHSFLFVQVLFLPLLIAIITSKSVELEEQGDMIKVILTSGIDLGKIYDTKLFHLLKSLFLYVSFLWLTIIGELSLFGFDCFTMPARLLGTFLSFIFISSLILILHYNIAIVLRKHLLNLSFALLGSLLGFISLFFMKFPIIPHSWYALVSSIAYVKTQGNHFNITLISIPAQPGVLSFILCLLLYCFGKKLFFRRKHD